ncbi:MAG TPA: hypothetical protein DHU59_08810 [Clostridiales bacterium]|nr:hypothetical protein [Clostridiales bacterium]
MKRRLNMKHLLSKYDKNLKNDVKGYALNLFLSSCGATCTGMCAEGCTSACGGNCSDFCSRGCGESCGSGAKWN